MRALLLLASGVIIIPLIALARSISVLVLQPLSTNGRIFGNAELYAAFMILPYAFKHFNERNGSIVPWLCTLKCNKTLKMRGEQLFDVEGLSSRSMSIIIDALADETNAVDIISGPQTSEASVLGKPLF